MWDVGCSGVRVVRVKNAVRLHCMSIVLEFDFFDVYLCVPAY